MKVTLKVDPALAEPEVTIAAPALTDEVRALAARLESGDALERPGALLGWRDGRACPLREEELIRCFTREKGVAAQTDRGEFDLRERLYELEARLDRHAFVRISQSEIINLRRVTALDLKLSGTIRITLAGETVCWVSRRYVKKIKEALGL